MPDDSGKAYLQRLAKNRLKTSPAYSTSMKKTQKTRPSMKNASLNTLPDHPLASPINKGNRQTGADVKVPPGNMNGPKSMKRSREVPVSHNKMRRVSS